MLIAYLTTDEVNQHLALQMAAEYGLMLCLLGPCDHLHGAAFDAVIYDWDYVPLERQQQILTELLSGPVPYPVAVHSYNLEEDQVEALVRQDVAVYRCLQAEVFQRLLQAANQAASPSGCDQENNHALEDFLLRRS
jgi:hypothetical protein